MTLREYVETLFAEPIGPAPVNETWKQTVARIRCGGTQEVSKTVYFFFLECLPPLFQWGDCFAFTEGREPARLFIRRQDKFLCRQLTWEQTVQFCRLAGVEPPS